MIRLCPNCWHVIDPITNQPTDTVGWPEMHSIGYCDACLLAVWATWGMTAADVFSMFQE